MGLVKPIFLNQNDLIDILFILQPSQQFSSGGSEWKYSFNLSC